jgi:hypothetical protein
MTVFSMVSSSTRIRMTGMMETREEHHVLLLLAIIVHSRKSNYSFHCNYILKSTHLRPPNHSASNSRLPPKNERCAYSAISLPSGLV